MMTGPELCERMGHPPKPMVIDDDGDGYRTCLCGVRRETFIRAEKDQESAGDE
jgi:hypothetical protein